MKGASGLSLLFALAFTLPADTAYTGLGGSGQRVARMRILEACYPTGVAKKCVTESKETCIETLVEFGEAIIFLERKISVVEASRTWRGKGMCHK